MNEIAKKVLALIESSDIFHLEEGPLLNSYINWKMHDQNVKPDDDVFGFQWINDEGEEFSINFTLEDIECAKIDGHKIILSSVGVDEIIECFKLTPNTLRQVSDEKAEAMEWGRDGE
jgi:hypothetical protein